MRSVESAGGASDCDGESMALFYSIGVAGGIGASRSGRWRLLAPGKGPKLSFRGFPARALVVVGRRQLGGGGVCSAQLALTGFGTGKGAKTKDAGELDT